MANCDSRPNCKPARLFSRNRWCVQLRKKRMNHAIWLGSKFGRKRKLESKPKARDGSRLSKLLLAKASV